MVSLDFVLTSLVVVLVPGTGALYTVSTGLAHGRAAAVHASLGCTLGILPHLAATGLGLAAILHASALAFEALKYAGVAYLLYVAWSTWRDDAAFSIDRPAEQGGPLAIVVRAVLLNVLNPKLTIFFLAYLPQFVEPGTARPGARLVVLSGVFMAMTFAVFVAYGALAHAFRRHVVESAAVQRRLRGVFAAAFAGLGLQLAASER